MITVHIQQSIDFHLFFLITLLKAPLKFLLLTQLQKQNITKTFVPLLTLQFSSKLTPMSYHSANIIRFKRATPQVGRSIKVNCSSICSKVTWITKDP